MASLTVATCSPSQWCSIPVWGGTSERVANDQEKGYSPVTGEIMYVRDKRKVAVYNGEFWSV
ncbi:hypothetical protein ABY41_gp086 [Synechococcus phage ACG-2014i]|uniref:Uncharacterized protein n=1 Tax=Synechococcus phage ACG-2014i TaxID=1493513 RepID=A0A0E3HJ44_9CAUD|nr:hypothetical protein ABY41_gp086 [Synechococcus phage ACG-2014i]AIX26807.1 hypothetical protein Syn7803US120_86 [Synechococcus phage ACG-2014i]